MTLVFTHVLSTPVKSCVSCPLSEPQAFIFKIKGWEISFLESLWFWDSVMLGDMRQFCSCVLSL